MILSKCNIQEFVAEQIEKYLANTSLSFDELKNYLSSKAPIPEVQTQCVKLLSASKQADIVKVKQALEEQAFKLQVVEDEKELKLLQQEESRDNDAYNRLNRDKTTISNLIASYESDRDLLRQKLTHIIGVATLSNLQPADNKKANTAFKDQSQVIEKLRSSIAEFESKIALQTKRYNSIQSKLHDIKTHQIQREEKKRLQGERAQARAGYKITGEGILDTLSRKSRTQLINSIKAQYTALDQLLTKNIEDAEAINFGFFLESLEKNLKKLKLSDPEKDALRISLSFMKKHLQLQQQILTTKESIKTKVQSIHLQIQRLKDSESKLHSLQKNTPNLKDANKELGLQNDALKISLDYHLKLRGHLATSSMLFLALAFIFSIPIILTSCGVIPFFLAPFVVYLLVSTPSATSLLTTIALGVAALVFHSKAKADVASFELNARTIKENNLLIKRNGENLTSLHKSTIPTLDKQLKKDESLRDGLTTTLSELQSLADQSLKQAKDIQPVPYSSSKLLTANVESTIFVDVPDAVEDKVEEDEFEEISLD